MTDYFPDKLEDFKNSPALITETGEVLTYFDLAIQADQFRERLGTQKCLLLIEARNSVEAVVAYIGALRGRHAVLLVPHGAQEKDATIQNTFQPNFVYRCNAGEWQLTRAPKADRIDIHEDLALLLSTSGTTGSVKLVRLSQKNIHANASSISRYLKLHSNDRAITSLPIHYSYGLSVLNSHLLVGASLVLTEYSVSDESFWSLAEKHSITSLAGVPYTYELFEKMRARDRILPSMRYLTQAGGRLSPELVKTYASWARERAIEFYVMYGQTEATARIAYLPPHLAQSHSDCIGVPIPDGELRLESETGEPILANNQEGELVYTGPNVMLGYATQRQHLSLGREITSLKTGDLALRTDEGLFRITGRTSRFSKLFGLRIGFDEIEKLLRSQSFNTYVTGNDQFIAIFTTLPDSRGRILDTLVERYKLPTSCFEIVEASTPPLLASGKIDYRGILSLALSLRNASEPVNSFAPGNAEARILSAYRSLRGGSSATREDSFLSLGGDSLSFVQLSVSLEKILGTVPKGWEKLSISHLAELATPASKLVMRVSTDIVIRALAILGVIVTHASDLATGGGAFLLFLVSGLNFARFQSPHLFKGQTLRVLRTYSVNILLPYFAILAAYLFLRKSPDVPSVLLVSNLFGRFGSFLEPFWFIDSLTQAVVIASAIFALPTMRFHSQQNPWTTGLIFVAFAACARLLLPDLSEMIVYADRLPQKILLLFALGWLLYFADSVAKRAAVSLLILCVGFAFYSSAISHLVWLIGGALAVVWIPSVLVPRLLGSVLTTISGSSYYIYLTHMVVVSLALKFTAPYALLLSLVLAPPLGVLCHRLLDGTLNFIRRCFLKSPVAAERKETVV